MGETSLQNPELKVGAHVLIQLGSELVTDVEQAILECVKNAYDADAPGCLINIDTKTQDITDETGSAARLLRFAKSSERVIVSFLDQDGNLISSMDDVDDDEALTRRLKYTGCISIEDKGDGLHSEQLQDSWLVVSLSSKRGNVGERKEKTPKGRTPLGDKGLGRLGSMKLGDILRIETSTSSRGPITLAQFRWADCEIAKTVDEIPVYVDELPNSDGFKGTRVSVLGLRDLADWRRKGRAHEIARSLARLISPFEATSSFPVSIRLDGDDHSLVAVTEDALNRAVADFTFTWSSGDEKTSESVLTANARFRKRLFTSARSQKAKERRTLIFDQDKGAGFANFLLNSRRLKAYRDKVVDIDAPWFVELKREFAGQDFLLGDGAEVADPGSFNGAFYFFHLDKLDLDEEMTEDSDDSAAAGLGVDRKLIQDMTGISILRDGFRVRSQGDWLGLSLAMTFGSTYGMRVDNTVGYFELTGEQNFKLVEKSDREGFVEDAAYRGFMQIARQCRNFANESLEQVRRALDEHYKKVSAGSSDRTPVTVQGKFRTLASGFDETAAAGAHAARIARKLEDGIQRLEQEAAGSASGDSTVAQALELANNAVTEIEVVRSKLSSAVKTSDELSLLRRAFDDQDERVLALFESAAVGLSARGLAHELRTHLTEIRQRVSAIERATKAKVPNVARHLRAIRLTCSAIASAAALIDPMLPRTRTIKDVIRINDFAEEYFNNRASRFSQDGVQTSVSGRVLTIRGNRPRLTQVLDNLVRNSIYWLNRGQFTGQSARGRQIELSVTDTGFIVSDTGPGVDPYYEETLFEIFVTGKPERDDGQGLGLFIVSELLRADGCEITLLPDRNENGRRFRFLVNLAPLVVTAQ